MKTSQTLVQLALLSLTSGTPIAQNIRARQNQEPNITWGPCDNYDFASPLECGSYLVPIDWTDTNVGWLNLELVRLPSTCDESRGSIFVNFGGPGDNGRTSLDALGPIMQSMTDGLYDLISITPRGTNDTLLFDCYGSPELRAAVPLSPAGNSSSTARDQTWAEAQLKADTCAVRQNSTGRYIGTAFVARDHHAVAKALGEGDSFKFWGISYGTVLGSTYAAMFPDTIERMLLDGVVNAHEYYRNEEIQMLEDSDKVFEAALTACAENADQCVLAQNRTASELIQFAYGWFEDLKTNPAVLQLPTGDGFIITYTMARTVLSNALYSPTLWPGFTSLMQAVIEEDVLSVAQFILNLPTATAADAEAQYGIKCGDVWEPQNDKEAVRLIQEARANQSSSFGDALDIIPATCGQWSLQAVESYRGDFRVNTSAPILLVGNTLDPVTPLAAAYAMSSGFGSSVVLEHGGTGHSVTSTKASRCTVDAIRDYFANGTLPAQGTVCEVEPSLDFGETGWVPLLNGMPAQCRVDIPSA